ncbi:MAG: hypothetical protein JXL81_02480 [Deltaproteobacteria bacterium]|nr:hypothetical protein [Deltaproteobacteria bacterium]
MSEIILTTRRLRLEKIEEGHKNNLFRLLSNPKVHKYFAKILENIYMRKTIWRLNRIKKKITGLVTSHANPKKIELRISKM